MRHGHIAIDLLLPAACALTIDGAFSKRMGILQKEVKASGVRGDSNVPKSLFCAHLHLPYQVNIFEETTP